MNLDIFNKEFARFKKINNLVNNYFASFGVNKKQELIRLIFEISKKEEIPPLKLIKELPQVSFDCLKDYLIKRRFPIASLENQTQRVYLPKIRLNKDSLFKLDKKDFYPKTIIIEKDAYTSSLTQRFIKAFPKAKRILIESLKSYLRCRLPFTIKDYNRRKDVIFIINEKADFFKRCPCTKKAISCGYHIFNLSFGCIFECTYCYLQGYTNSPGIIFSSNLDRFFDLFNAYKKPKMRIGSGEFTDSLMLDHITEYSLEIIDFFRKYPDARFEFKTKSKNIENLLKAKHKGNIVVSWTLSPERIIKENEFFTARLSERVISIERCIQAGYKIGLHFDPVIYFDGWRKEYSNLIEMLFRKIKPKDIAWISIGTLRFNPRLKPIIEARFPHNKILDQELIYGFDNKLRYPSKIRQQIYSYMTRIIYKYSRRIFLYLCMEEQRIWKTIFR
ncbi:MAG: hypothetical protein NC912_06400 [Candidatus Omnitrophica bacterium]|nr:hypothetical protein [Candidatus Omnitrophota bacterium]